MVNLLTIVTVNKNNFKGLLSTLSSLHSNELNSSIYHLIIDGGSSDLTTTLLDLKKKYKFEFVSENDNGIYHAMNKGILLSRTDRLLFLNSGGGEGRKRVAAADAVIKKLANIVQHK